MKAANNDAIIQAFPVAAFAKDGAPVIEVGRLYTADLQEFTARQRLGATGVDASRTFVEHIHSYPENLETEVTITYTRAAGGAGAAAAARQPRVAAWAPARCAATAPPSCCITAWCGCPKNR